MVRATLAGATGSDRVTVGGVSVLIPPPPGFENHWEFVETLQRATPNDPDLAPRLMVLIRQDDMSRTDPAHERGMVCGAVAELHLMANWRGWSAKLSRPIRI